jgi:hypothetical protein
LKSLRCLNVSENLNITDEALHSFLLCSSGLECLALDNCRLLTQRVLPLLAQHARGLKRLSIGGMVIDAQFFATNLQLPLLLDLVPGAAIHQVLASGQLTTLLNNCPSLYNLCAPNVAPLFTAYGTDLNRALDETARLMQLMPELEGIYSLG